MSQGQAVLQRYERIAFDKTLISVPGKTLAAFVCPGHPLLDATLDLIIERYRDLLKRGAILVDDTDEGDQPRSLLFLEHAIQDASIDRAGNRRVVSKRMQFVEVGPSGEAKNAGPAPYLDYRRMTAVEADALAKFDAPNWLRQDLETLAMEHAAIHLVPRHLDELRKRKEEVNEKTKAAVQDRLTKEINYWDHRAAQLKDQELAGKTNARLNSGLARQRADDLTGRLQKRLMELEQERKLSALPPVILGGAMIVPVGLLRKLRGEEEAASPTFAIDTERSELMAMEAVMAAERRLGFAPRDISDQNLGYDIESSIPGTGLLRFIEVKGRGKGAKTLTITKNEILTGLNKPDEFILAIVVIDQDTTVVRYCRTPFE